MAKSPMPPFAFIGGKNKVKHKHVVFIIDESDIEGIPLKLRMMLDDDTVKVKEGAAFMTGYVPAHMTEPNREGKR